ncbi:unnamed protein product [Vitrella brassicaformis CCMP3155]|uniref:Thioredoxin domain-containing protein n=2 Tax=Vitrella brassicaformis TaxID=1169539 RepID=A0A0G4G5G7_VITBC|nr:unnamed protein product [Vitrella brassicaformis CCMP3155]|mmetsp:Transcript_19468/g.47085  ORF Transcript_19468/g.47085 Transcript_19468/m.47085 type:complete len:172 (+) Transcript_19468:317-832(+)|eukprot:CEM23295.1 unnamed protein product [Vitrella brassicaformis CCMP3155]
MTAHASPFHRPLAALCCLVSALLLALTPALSFQIAPSRLSSVLRPSQQSLRARGGGRTRVFGAAAEVPEGEFKKEVLEADTPVLVDFTATWCGPCKLIAPFVDQLGDELQGQVKVVKVDTDKHKFCIKDYGIRGLPMLAVFKDGKVLNSAEGALTKPQIFELVSSVVPVKT